MPQPEHITIDVHDIRLTEAPGERRVTLGELPGVQLLVLLRHRH